MSETTTITVTGMTCEHCVTRVHGEISALAGVSDVQVDLPTGRVTVHSADALSIVALRAAVDEAGYELAGD